MTVQRTPWGAVQTQRTLAEGIVSVCTAGHGGFVLSDERMKALPERFKLNVYGQGRYFEEDCEWALVVAAFPEEFAEDHRVAAQETITRFYPQLLIAPSSEVA